MRILKEFESLDIQESSAVTIGVFDGVHLGHRHLISKLKEVADRQDLISIVLTFSNHPSSVLRSDFEPQYLTGIAKRIRLIEETGVDRVLQSTFDIELSKLPASDFIQLLRESLKMEVLVAGPDFAMGQGRKGNIAYLENLGREIGFSLNIVDPLVSSTGEIVRSTSVRDSVSSGDVERSTALLGRPYSISGTVIKGDGRGIHLGFPTANLDMDQENLLPLDGIYATWAEVNGKLYRSATSIGNRPTFENTSRSIETFLIDFNGDLYNSELNLQFVRRLRDEVKYTNVEDLKNQIRLDVIETKRVLDKTLYQQLIP